MSEYSYPESEPAIETSANSSPAILQVEGLYFDHPQRTLFKNFSLCIPSGVTLVCGGEDSGKSTLLRLLAGELTVAAGSLRINHVLHGEQAALYRQQIYWIDPRSEAFDQVTPAAYFAFMMVRYPAFDKAALATLIEGLSLAPHMEKSLYMLSTGTKRKVWLAAGFAAGATVTLLDEPFASLDRASINFVLRLLDKACADPARACVVAGYEAPGEVTLASVIDLDQRA